MATPDIPLVDISAWRTGGMAQRERLAERLDQAMRDSGFFLVSGHGIPSELLSDIRSASKRFFALPRETKARYRTHVGGRGWIAKGDEANSFYGVDADPTKADLKETFTVGRKHATGDAALDAEWFLPNVWPAEVPELAALGGRWTEACRELYYDLLDMLATALRLPEHFFRDRAQNSPHTFNINRYPAMDEVGAAQDGQFRVGPHTDWGMLTILDRQPGYGGLQVQTLDGEWADAPYVEGAYTINIADMLARWTGDRWRSTRHRVLPPPADAPTEELISLIMFMEADMDQIVEPFAPPVGGGTCYEPVLAADYFTQRARAATVA
ncbi:isopenicillin N synthase family dioxygenase [Streptomyces acidiscabies]|uniref:isopenicillin N synthase family dioxygenase n=1 Tax=Streptomyces acidiscabies TaxID=42234 RepID=UPI0038F6BEB4